MQRGLNGRAAPPIWDARMVPSSQGCPLGVTPSLPVSLASTPSSQMVTAQAPAANLTEEVANKSAEISVLRSRMKRLEDENLKMKNEVAMAKDQSAQTEKSRQMRGEVERLQNELRYAKQDLISSEEERKRLKTSSVETIAELSAIKNQQLASQMANQSTPSFASSTMALDQRSLPNAPLSHQMSATSLAQPQRTIAVNPTPMPTQHKGGSNTSQPSRSVPVGTPAVVDMRSSSQSSHPATSKTRGRQWRQDVLLRELAAWEAISKGSGCSKALPETSRVWFSLHDAVNRLAETQTSSQQFGSLSKMLTTDTDIATIVARQLEAGRKGSRWVEVQSGAQFVKVLFGLLPRMVSIMRTKALAVEEVSAGLSLCEVLTNVLHDVVLGSESEDKLNVSKQEEMDGKVYHDCVSQVLGTMLEITSKLRPHELIVFSNAFRRPSLCALLSEDPRPESLHMPCLALLQVLLSSSELYALAHGADSRENPLLAVANLLIVPAIEPGESNREVQHSSDLQQSRIAALEVFCRCLASAPRLDIVLQLRGAPTSGGGMADTVLQRIVFLCHHDLLCLGMHGVDGGPWHEQSMKDSGMARQRAVELSLMILSSFVWHAAPWTPDVQSTDHTAACSDACALLGRMRPLLASIVDMVVRRAADSSYYASLLGRTSALRILLPHLDGENNVVNEASLVGLGGEKAGSAMVPMMVE